MVLVVPFGVTVGYAQVAVPFLLGARGVEVAAIGAVSALAQWPHGWKFLWAPVLDAGWPRKNWFLLSVVVAAIALAATTFIPPDPARSLGPLRLLSVYTLVLAIAQGAVATSSAAIDAVMATTLPDNKKGAAAGWSMAGNLGGTGVGGALALWLVLHTSASFASIVLAAICLVSAVPALFIHEERRARGEGTTFHRAVTGVRALLRDLWRSLKSREGWTGLLICMSPVGTGAATQLFSAIAPDYGARETHVEFVNGVFGGIVGALGCLVGGYLADRMNRRLLYVLAGLLTAGFALAFAFGPANTYTLGFPTTFTLGCLSYQFANGIAYAAFAAFVLEMVGHGPGVTTKYALYVGVSNQAISYVTWLDGKGYDWGKAAAPGKAWGGRVGVLGTDVVATLVGVVVLGALYAFLRRRPPPVTDEGPAAA